MRIDVHLHTTETDNTEQLDRIETLMSALSEALAGATERVTADIAHLQDLLETALATETANTAEIARLREEAAAVVADTQGVVDALNAWDPDPSNPVPVELPPEEPPVV